MPETEVQQTLRHASTIGLAALGGAAVGFVLQLAVAYYFGAGQETDAFFMAQSTSELLSKLLLGGSITAVFIPLFIDRITQGKKEEAWDLGLNILHLTGAFFVIAIFLLALFAQPFVNFIAPGFSAEATTLTISLLRFLLPSFLLLFMVEFVTSMLHAVRHFTTPALLRLVAPGVSLITLTLTVHSLGIYALALGVILGSIAQLSLVSWALRRQGARYKFIFRPHDPALKNLFYLVYPFIFSVLMTQGAGIVYRILVSDLTVGSLSALKFAEKITQLLTIIFLSSITAVLFPLLSSKAAIHDTSGLKESMGQAIRLIAFLTLPLIIGVSLLREPFVIFLFERGSFTAEDTTLTSQALLFLVLGLTMNGISSVFGHATLALKETRAAVAITVASQAIAIMLFVLLVPPLAHAGLALGSSLVPAAITLLYFLYLTRFIPNLRQLCWHPTYAKIIFLSLGLGLVVYLTARFTNQSLAELPLAALWQTVIPALAGSLVYGLGAWWWQVPEMKLVTEMVAQKLRLIKFNHLDA